MIKSNEVRELSDIELELVASGCCTVKWGHLPHGPNPWLTYGSPERGGK